MSAIDLRKSLPASVQIRGLLLSAYQLPDDLPLLDQDILELALPNGMRIDVGWFPENDPDGRFVVRVFRANRSVPVRTPFETRAPMEVGRFVSELATEYTAAAGKKVGKS